MQQTGKAQPQAMGLERQKFHLAGVSRTFALTIPLLDGPLPDYVGNAYLLCRIADTVEDDPKAEIQKKRAWLKEFAEFAQGRFTDGMKLISLQTKALQICSFAQDSPERILLCEMAEAVGRTRAFPRAVISVIARAVAILSYGMARSLGGAKVSCQDDLDSYCYFVAGAVGEMLAALFALYDPKADHERLMALAPSFGQGLQMVNIIKDRAVDQGRGVSFLPPDAAQEGGILHYVQIACGHLHDAMDFTRTLPLQDIGIRRFCLLCACMAAATLRLYAADPDGASLKITRSQVRRLCAASSACAGNNLAAAALFRFCARGIKPIRRDPAALRRKVSWWDKETFNILIGEKDA
ncbi:MAG: squalene/phytoene synthase family protein [Succinivibrio sp.]